MTKQATDCACGSGAVRTRSSLSSVWRSKTATGARCYRGSHAGETRRAVLRPARLAAPGADRPCGCPTGARVVFTGCGTSFHAAQTGGWAVQALEAVLSPPEADLHGLRLARGRDAADARGGPRLPRAEVGSSPARRRLAARRARRRGVVCTPELERSWCHTASYTCAVAAIARAARRGHRQWLAGRGRGGARPREPAPVQDEDPRRRRGPRLADCAGGGAEAARGRVDVGRRAPDRAAPARPPRRRRRGVRAYVLEGEGRAAERAHDAVAALEALGCETTLVPDAPPRGRHRPLPAADARARRGARHRPRPDPPRRPARRGRTPRAARIPASRARRARPAGRRLPRRCCSGRCRRERHRPAGRAGS